MHQKEPRGQTNTQSSCSFIVKGELKLHVKNGDVIQELRSGTYCGRQDGRTEGEWSLFIYKKVIMEAVNLYFQILEENSRLYISRKKNISLFGTFDSYVFHLTLQVSFVCLFFKGRPMCFPSCVLVCAAINKITLLLKGHGKVVPHHPPSSKPRGNRTGESSSTVNV